MTSFLFFTSTYGARFFNIIILACMWVTLTINLNRSYQAWICEDVLVQDCRIPFHGFAECRHKCQCVTIMSKITSERHIQHAKQTGNAHSLMIG